jgi:glycosyltransferase involved in cell wall biosynthesis
MRVIIDSRIQPDGGGAGGLQQCLIGLASGLRELNAEQNRFTFLTLPRQSQWIKNYAGGCVQAVEMPVPIYSVRERIKRLSGPLRPLLGRVARRAKLEKAGAAPMEPPSLDSIPCPVEFDVWHTTSPYLAVRSAKPVVFTLHDIQHRHFPRFFTPDHISWRDHFFSSAIREATTVTTVSEFCRKDIQTYYNVPEDKIKAIRWGAPVACYSPHPLKGEKSILTMHGIQKPFALYPSETYEHKNHVRLLEAAALLREKAGETFQVVCTGKQRHAWTKIADRLKSLALEKTVVFTGYIPEFELRNLFENATGLIFPSLFEGAGLALIEALESRLPIACSDIPPFREYADDAALFFNPMDMPTIANGLDKILFDGDVRQRLFRAAGQRRECFDWISVARDYLSVYESAFALHGTGVGAGI